MIASRRVWVWAGLVAALAATRGLLALTQPRFEPAPTLLSLDPARVDRVQIARGSTEVDLRRTEQGWVVASAGELPAKAEVGALVERLAGWRRERVAGEAPRAEWGVGASEARRVTLSAGGAVLGELLVGQVTGVEPEDVREVGYALDTSQLGLFVRLPDEGRVYVVTDFVTRELEPDPRRWFAPPVPVRPEEVTRLQRAGPEGFDLLSGPFRFAGDPTPLDPRRAWGLLTWVAQLRTVAPADPELAQGGLALRLEAGDRAYALQLAERDGRMFLLLGERCVEVEPLAASRLLEATRASLVRTRLLLSDARDVVRVEATLGQRAVSFLRVRGGWVAGDGGAVPDLDGVLGALGGVPVTWGEPAVGKIAGASLQVIDAQGGSETLWLLEEAPADEERIGLGGVSLVARAAGRPLAEALQTLFGE